ncbi:MAG TPA: heme-degrading domain-containing protein [Treponema sp.]|nr:MAG: hypothetical protein A2Y36_07925 [Treponema sp. GWA1_62_8]OHE68593.1 MAG: hypothetical protein A2001_05655 [Treponema sp. GWC1_61_84]OHE74132.1 MAG: hypothetical protein A2413_12940 [Treponema sp. RIFOXYC1_FULL_61_9]HCM26536.1 heme-degrading domain-containing protein [Treponema sp.]
MTPTKDLLDRIAAEEAELVLEKFDEDDAWKLGNLLAKEARARGAPVAVDIRRPGRILFHASLPGAAGDNDEWIRRKANVCFRMEKSSFAVGIALALSGKTIEEKHYVSSMEFSAFGGAFPIRVRGAGLVACATVSGLPQEDDHALVVACLRELKG